MSLQVEKLEKNMAKLTIEASAEDFEKAIQKVYLKARGRINIPGFRKGKAPRKLIEKMYGTGVFYEDAANDLIPTAYAEALKDCDLEIVSRPEINVTDRSWKTLHLYRRSCCKTGSYPWRVQRRRG